MSESTAETIKRLVAERDELFAENGKIANTLGAENLRLRAQVRQCASELHEAANLIGMNLPRTAILFEQASQRAHAAADEQSAPPETK